jgi:hypothetical protein
LQTYRAPVALLERERPMPRYFFDVETGKALLLDDMGDELANEQSARDEAVKSFAELARDYLPSVKTQDNMIMRVRNEKGEPLLKLTLNFALQPLK